MAYDESFMPEPETAEAPPVAQAAPAPELAPEVLTDDAQPEASTATAEQPTADTTVADADKVAPTEAAATQADTSTEQPTAPAFDEANYLKTALGEEAPKSAAELKERLTTLAAKQVTPEQEAQLALLRDPAKLAEFAQLATKDYDKPEAIDVMREHYALKNPGLTEAALERRFQRQFSEKYPTLADALANPENYQADDPALLADKEDADIDAQADRAALKTAQQERTNQFLASQTAATQPQLTAEQQADIAAVPTWLDQTYKPGSAISVDAGDGLKINLPITDPAAFKAAFFDPVELINKLTLTKPIAEGGVLNRENQALVTAFLQNPAAFVQNIAKQVRLALPEPEAALSVDTLTNSSASRRPAAKAPAAVAAVAAGESNQPAGIDAEAWLNNHY